MRLDVFNSSASSFTAVANKVLIVWCETNTISIYKAYARLLSSALFGKHDARWLPRISYRFIERVMNFERFSTVESRQFAYIKCIFQGFQDGNVRRSVDQTRQQNRKQYSQTQVHKQDIAKTQPRDTTENASYTFGSGHKTSLRMGAITTKHMLE